nr:MAG: hypothetical protein DIU54_02705 [Acidobacteriota bacterium]
MRSVNARRALAFLLAAGMLAGPAAAAAGAGQTPDWPTSPGAETGTTEEPQVVVPVTPGDLARIRRALDGPPALRIDDADLRFYVQVLATQPTFAEYVKGYNFLEGPTRRGNPMTHAEFLTMVTPKEMYSSVGITARETLELAFTNWLAQTLIRRAFEDLQRAKDEREIQAIRDRIDRELAMLNASSASK